MNIIIKTPGFIGDTIMMLPALELLKTEYPNANFTIVTQKYCVDIFREKGIKNIIIDNTKEYRIKRVFKTFSLIKQIRKEKYDLGFVFHNTLHDVLMFKLSGVKKVIGYNKENTKFFLNFWLNIDRLRHYANHYAYLVNAFLKFKYTKLPNMTLNYKKSNLLQNNSKKNVGFVFGGKNKGPRSYPTHLSNELFTLLKNENINIVLLGDQNDNENNNLYENHINSTSLHVTNLSGKTSIAEFIDVIGSIDLLVTIDSSAMHIAASVDTKFIALIGKGTSPFEIVKPKVNFGVYLKQDNLDIDDNILIKNIKPSLIHKTIKNQIQGIENNEKS